MTDHEKHLQTTTQALHGLLEDIEHAIKSWPHHNLRNPLYQRLKSEEKALHDVLERLPLLEATRRMWLAQGRVMSSGLSDMEREAAFAESREAGDALRALEAKAKGEP